MSKVTDILAIQDKEQVRNSYYRAPKQVPHIKKLDESTLEVRTADETVTIGKLEEVVLYIVSSFKYSPLWLVDNWFYSYKINGYETVTKWIAVGLVWAETTSVGIFLRPTRFLLDLFKDSSTDKFLEISHGMINHTCSEQQIMFEIFMGDLRSELWQVIKEEETLPNYHPLELTFENDSGTLAIRESEFRIGFKRYNSGEILEREREIERQVKAEVKYSEEFNDFSRFPIVRVNSDGELVTQTPDIIIPIPRQKGKAQSYAIEIELSPKQQEKYITILENYKDNIKFGKLLYLCGSQKIASMVKSAYKSLKGLGSCELYLIPFTAPAQRLDIYSQTSEQSQANILKTSNEDTV